MDRLKAIESFVEVVSCGSFTNAARKLRTSRAMVSRYVQQLEQHLNAQLFNRTTRRLSLTEVGEEYYASCRRILTELHEAETSVSHMHAEPRGKLRVTAPTSFSNVCLAPIIADFIAANPDISVSLVLRRTSFTSVEIADTEADLAICLADRLVDSSFIARKIGEDEWIACAAPRYLKSRGAPQHPEELVGHNCLLTRGENSTLWAFDGISGRTAVNVRGSLIGNVIAVRAAALAGVGIALLPSYCVAPDLAGGTLRRICPAFSAGKRHIFAVYPQTRYLPKKVRTFVDFLAARLRQGAAVAAPGGDLPSARGIRRSARQAIVYEQ